MVAGTLDISQARKQFNTIDRRLHKERLIWITRHQRKAFALIDADYLETVLETMEVLADPEAMEMLRRSIDDIRAGRLHDHDDVNRELLR